MDLFGIFGYCGGVFVPPPPLAYGPVLEDKFPIVKKIDRESPTRQRRCWSDVRYVSFRVWIEQNVYVSTPTMSPIAAPASAAGSADDGDGGAAADDAGDELVPMLCLYYDNDEARSDQLQTLTHGYSTASTCFSHAVSLCLSLCVCVLCSLYAQIGYCRRFHRLSFTSDTVHETFSYSLKSATHS